MIIDVFVDQRLNEEFIHFNSLLVGEIQMDALLPTAARF